MSPQDLIGRVAARYLREQFSEDEAEGTATFILDALSADQAAAVATAALSDPWLAERLDVKLPAAFLSGKGLPAEALTEQRATYFRNAPCGLPARLLANIGDDEEQSLRELSPIGSAQLQSRPDLWVALACPGLPLSAQHKAWWEKALKAVHELRLASLDRLAEYVVRTRKAVEDQGLPMHHALGRALPALKLPCNSRYFEAIDETRRTHASQWKRLLTAAQNKLGCYLLKQQPSGIVLSDEELRTSFARVAEDIPEHHHPVIEGFLAAPTGWNAAAERLAECEWEEIRPLFDGLRRERFNLGKATEDFYAERDPSLLSDDERDYLKRLISRRTTHADLDEDQQFYDAHRSELREDRKLKSAWDRFIYGTPREAADFIVGLVSSLESLFDWDTHGERREITIRCEARYKKDFRALNSEAGLYFATRYRGLPGCFGNGIKWDVGELFRFDELYSGFAKKKELNNSEARAALRLKFMLELNATRDGGTEERRSSQFVWFYDPKCVTSEFVGDWTRLRAHPLVRCQADREPTSKKGTAQTVDLYDAGTFVAAYGHDRGSFVPGYRAERDIGRAWRQGLENASSRGYLDDDAAGNLLALFEAFQTKYAAAIQAFVSEGLTAGALEEQASAFGALLEAICRLAKGDRNRELLLRPLFHIGTIHVEGGGPTAVVAPWHPLRLAAMSRKTRMAAALLSRLVSEPELRISDPRLYFNDAIEGLQHPYYPELVLGWGGNTPELLSLTDTAVDYSLHEMPFLSPTTSEETNETPTEGANRVAELVQRYLRLHPHEQANLSVVLYNCDSARLPIAVVEKIAALQRDEEDARCRVILRHRHRQRLQRLYEEIVEGSDGDADAFVASETTQDFMARLRIGIMADQAPPPNPKEGCPEDIVFSQDVIARHAKLAWYQVDADPVEPRHHSPGRWSRRRPVAIQDMKSVTYLCCPVQTREGWAYLTALATFLRGDWDESIPGRSLPARQLDFHDTETAEIFDETHNIGNWVANYDELLDRRQLLEQGVRIIRYKQVATQGRNLVVSSRAPVGLLRSMVLSRLRDLDLGIEKEDYQGLAQSFIDDANDISGDIVLRAAKRGRSASELIGVVLSRYLVRHEFRSDHQIAWFFLDDYADWLGQREGQIADILALIPQIQPDGAYRLAIVITEAKYVDASAAAAKRRESHRQLGDTLKRMSGALFGEPIRVDRDLWLDRVSDLLVDGMRYPVQAKLDLEKWRRAIRDGRCEIAIRGYSHIFISGPVDAADTSSTIALPDLTDAWQEVFGRTKVRELVLRYHAELDPTPTRVPEESGDGDPPAMRYAQVQAPSPTAQPLLPDIRPAWSKTGTGEDYGAERDALLPARVAETPPEGGQPWASAALGHWLLQGTPFQSETDEEREWLRTVANRTKAALQQFNLQSKLVASALTPNAALLKFAGSAQLTVDLVRRRETEFLTTHGLQLVAIQPEAGVISLAIARPKRQVVSLRELWQRWKPDGRHGNSDLLIGVREDDGELLILSPGKEHAPHSLIAGSTGSGKSVLMQNIILGIAATNRAEMAKIILIDPKQGVDYFAFEGLPHLSDGIIDAPDDALGCIHALVEEMDSRYRRLRAARAPNLRAFNALVSPEERMPTLWLIHDEFAEWMLVDDYKDAVTASVARLGVKARAAGIHLVFAAQRPEATVMPMQLRANLGNRLILRVDSEGTSELSLGDKGGERLLGRGHLIARLEGAPSLVYAQVPLASSAEIETMVGMITADPVDSKDEAP